MPVSLIYAYGAKVQTYLAYTASCFKWDESLAFTLARWRFGLYRIRLISYLGCWVSDTARRSRIVSPVSGVAGVLKALLYSFGFSIFEK